MKNNNHKELIILLLLAVAASIFLYLFTEYTNDDAFITFRYAKNISEGNGWVFNSGEKVQGTSSPLFTLLLCTLSIYIFGSEALPAVIRLVLLLSSLTSLFLLWQLLSKMHETAKFLVIALFALYPKVVLINISGMEAPL